MSRLASSYGFQWIVWLLSRGGAVFLRGTDAAETMQAFELYKVQGMVAAPSGLAEFVELYEQSPDFTCPFDVIVAGGSLLWKSLADRVRMRMCPHLVTSYGASEFSPIATAPHHQISGTAGAVGYVCAGATVQAVDDSDRPLAPGETGLIRVRGDFLVEGYVGNPAGSDQAFRNGWFYPGDIGAVTADNVLVISGRQTAVLNVGGNKMGPEAIEQAALAFPGVAQAGAFGVENEFGILEVWTAVVAPRGLDEAGLHRHLQKRFARPVRPTPDFAAGQPAEKYRRQARPAPPHGHGARRKFLETPDHPVPAGPDSVNSERAKAPKHATRAIYGGCCIFAIDRSHARRPIVNSALALGAPWSRRIVCPVPERLDWGENARISFSERVIGSPGEYRWAAETPKAMQAMAAAPTNLDRLLRRTGSRLARQSGLRRRTPLDRFRIRHQHDG